MSNIHVTAHLGSILTTFYTVHCYNLIPKWIKFTSPPPQRAKCCLFYVSREKNTRVRRCSHKFSMKFGTELRCAPLTVLEMFLQPHWSPSVLRSADWTRFGSAHARLYATEQTQLETLELWSLRRLDYLERSDSVLQAGFGHQGAGRL